MADGEGFAQSHLARVTVTNTPPHNTLRLNGLQAHSYLGLESIQSMQYSVVLPNVVSVESPLAISAFLGTFAALRMSRPTFNLSMNELSFSSNSLVIASAYG
jgi:hypothetical protein